MLAYERALELAPGDGFVLERLEHLGALLRIEGPDGEVFWLTPGRFRARHAPRARLRPATTPISSSCSATACSVAATSRSPPRRPSCALAGSEDLPGAWALAGLTRAALGRELQAREALGRAAALDPSNVAVARALVQREDDPEGDLPRAHAEVQRRPGSAAAWIVLGDYLAAAAQPNEALGAYAHALDLDPALPGAEHAREALRVLG